MTILYTAEAVVTGGRAGHGAPSDGRPQLGLAGPTGKWGASLARSRRGRPPGRGGGARRRGGARGRGVAPPAAGGWGGGPGRTRRAPGGPGPGAGRLPRGAGGASPGKANPAVPGGTNADARDN